MNKLTGLVALALLTLTACGKGDEKAKGAGKAEGEILPGSTTDAMIPVDQIKSQPPLAPKAEGSDKPDDKGKPAAAKAAKPASDAPADEAPAEDPAPAEQ
ncbi:MAG: hypothetical protein ACKOPE_09340 [Novosphingobium sp.]